MSDDFPLRATLRAVCNGRTTDRVVRLAVGESVRLGRKPRLPTADPAYHPDFGSDLVFPDDERISNFQATLRWDGQRVLVTNRPGAANPIADPDDPAAAPSAAADLTPGGRMRFRIGETVFALAFEDPPRAETLSDTALGGVPFTDPGVRLDALAKLPDRIRRAADDDLAAALFAVVLDGVPRAEEVAIVDAAADPGEPVRALHAQARTGAADCRPSRQLVRRAVHEYENVAYVWPPTAPADGDAPTANADRDWAVCVRLPGALDRGLYLAGRRPPAHPADRTLPGLAEDVKFARLAADIYAGQCELRAITRQARFLQRLVSPAVRAAIEGAAPEEATAPRDIAATVLFCDLRGFTSLVERGEGRLRATWDRLSTALDKMTAAVLDHDGVVGDFQGDAIMGFWGWPLPQADQIDRAAKAALAIRRRFAGLGGRPDHPLADLMQNPARLPCGIGLAHGPAVAGCLGAAEQFKIGLFGPVVNRAARLEAATKRLGVPIAVDEAVGDALRDQAWCRTRRIGKFRPPGVRGPVFVHELLPPPQEPAPNVREEDRKRFEAAVDQFLRGEWAGCEALLHTLPADGPSEFLLEWIAKARAAGQSPDGWDGVIAIEK